MADEFDLGASPAGQRFRQRLRDLQDQGANHAEIEAVAPKFFAEEFGAGPWDSGTGYAQPSDDPLPHSRMPPPKPKEEPPLWRKAIGGLGDAAEFMRGATNSFLANAPAGMLSMFDPEKTYDEAFLNLEAMQEAVRQGKAAPWQEMIARKEFELADADRNDSREHRGAAFAGRVAGGLYSPGSKVASVIGKAAPVVKGSVKALDLTSGLGRAMAAGGVGAGTDALLSALTEGKDASQTVDQTALAMLTGGFLGGIGKTTNNALRDPRGDIGRNIIALERGRDFLKSPQNKALPHGQPGIGALANDVGTELGETQARKLAEARANMAAAEDALPTSMDDGASVVDVHRRLNRSVDRFSNKRPVSPGVESAVDEIKKDLTGVSRQRITPVPKQEVIGYKITPVTEPQLRQRMVRTKDEFGQEKLEWKPYEEQVPVGFESGDEIIGDSPTGAVERYVPGEEVETAYATPRDLVKARRGVRKKAEFGLPTTPENAPYREIYGSLADATHSPTLPDNIGKLLQDADSEFSKAMTKIAEGNELIFGQDNARAVTDSVAAGKRAASVLRQSLMDTAAGGNQLRILEQIRNLGPEYAAAVDKVAAKIAEQGTKPGMPRTFSHTGKWPYQLLTQNLRFGAIKGLEPLTASPRVPAAAGAALAPILRDPLEALLTRQREDEQQ